VTSFGYQLESGNFAPRVATLPRFHKAVADALGQPDVNQRVVRDAWAKVLPGSLTASTARGCWKPSRPAAAHPER
jgi:hypothetical protein